MAEWSKFEEESTKFLNETYGSQDRVFRRNGGYDSTQPDIEFFKNNKNIFNMEVKKSPSQSGQFVVHYNTDNSLFEFSSKNLSEQNNHTKDIIKYMNLNAKTILNKKSGAQLNMSQVIFKNWIVDYYSSKKVKYIITEDNNTFVILPLSKINDYFEISAKYRMKRSGTSNLGKKYEEEAVEAILKLYPTAKFYKDNKRLIVSFDHELNKSKQYIGLSKIDIYLSKKSTNKNDYIIRQRSKTKNYNVIFSLRLIKNQDLKDLRNFENDVLS